MIPKVIIVDSNGNLISEKGRREVEDRGVAAFRSWFNQSQVLAKTSDIATNALTDNSNTDPTVTQTKVRFS